MYEYLLKQAILSIMPLILRGVLVSKRGVGLYICSIPMNTVQFSLLFLSYFSPVTRLDIFTILSALYTLRGDFFFYRLAFRYFLCLQRGTPSIFWNSIKFAPTGRLRFRTRTVMYFSHTKTYVTNGVFI